MPDDGSHSTEPDHRDAVADRWDGRGPCPSGARNEGTGDTAKDPVVDEDGDSHGDSDGEETFTVVVVTAVTDGDSLLGWSPWGQPVIVVGDADVCADARQACATYGMMLAFVPERLVVALDGAVRELFDVPLAPAP